MYNSFTIWAMVGTTSNHATEQKLLLITWWVWVAIESESKEILGISVSKERNMFIAERFISSLIKRYGKHSISTDGGT